MKNNLFLKLLSSILIILITMYFSRFLGVCLIILRCFVHTKKNISIYLLVSGVLILIPKFLNIINIKFSYLNNILRSDIYNKNFINYAEFLLILGVIILIIEIIAKTISSKINSSIKSYIMNSEKKDYEISEKNDLIMKEKREKALNTSYVKCPSCGADNIISSKVAKCKFCRSALVGNEGINNE